MDPGLPNPNPLTPFWLEHNPLKTHRTTPHLPSEADVVIIGSGIAGASVAWHLLRLAEERAAGVPAPRVVVLEARETCSGATGRNGGHIIPLHCRYFNERVRSDGFATTAQITRFEHRTLEQLQALVKKYNIDCEWRLNGCVLGAQTEMEWTTLQADWRAMQQAGIGIPAEVWDREQCQKNYQSDAFIGAIKIPGCQLWPAKLVWGIVELALAKGLNLQTYTPVTSVTPQPTTTTTSSPVPQWLVTTPRGNLRTTYVIHCTNAWAGHLLPALAPLIRPIRAQVIATERFTTPRLWSFGTSFNHGFDYGMQRPDRMVIFGGMRYSTPSMEVDQSDDGQVNPAIDRALRSALLRVGSRAFASAPASPPSSASSYSYASSFRGETPLVVAKSWTGIMGFSSDYLPWVGPLAEFQSDLSNQFICAGFSGDGMPRAYQCADIVARMVLNQHFGKEGRAFATGDLIETFRPAARVGQTGKKWDILGSDRQALLEIGIEVPSKL
ncbi:FAD dependent oxidoreductase [Dimargaris cristalligena]|uniref:FAD dependent oxidoreductase n=1 Tax=Dimargaris cristalligena TaxID=215637 RepID=A0A4V1J5P4_9FUNG|nr:FAD dependent oxidoreductase [Dimargaris cristalligena]|eukprot:RKP39769.1 FAD dependent oxidoreductase [Dimargaris cristalligena]